MKKSDPEGPLFCVRREAGVIAAGKYAEWLTPDGLTLLEQWAREGLTDEEIAKKLHIARGTLYKWMAQHGDIRDAIKKGKELPDAQVESALYRASVGYDYEETYTEVTEAANGGKRTVTRTYRRHMPPNVTAAIYWLNNRRPDRWRAKPSPDASDALGRLDQLLEETRRAADT